MANNTTLNSELYTALLAEAQFAAYENSIARQIVTAFDFPANSGTSLQVPIYASTSAVDLTEGVAPSASDVGTSSATITLSEIGHYSVITDFLRDSAQRNVITDLGFSAGAAIAEKMDQGVFNLFGSFTTQVGVEDAQITVNNIFEAAAELRANKVMGPYYAVLDPRQALSLKKELATAGGANLTASGVGNDVLRGFYIGTVAGVQIFESVLVDTVNTDADADLNAVGAVFSPKAIGHAIRGGIRMEDDRRAAARATDIMVSAVVGQTILQDSFGVKLVGLV